MLENYRYQIFGSKSSTDLDAMFFVDYLDKILDNHDLIKSLNKELEKIYHKPANSNLCVIRNGIVIETFKGTSDEVNNSMLYTYPFHIQKYPNMIDHYVPRDIELKIIRTTRVLLTFLSRTEYRSDVKKALKNECDISTRFDLLRKIPLNIILTGEKVKKVEYIDLLKTIAFQLGQTLALTENIELYTKEDISLKYPDLSDYLFRKNIDISSLLKRYDEFLNIDDMILIKRIEN